MEYQFIYRLNVAYNGCDVSSIINQDYCKDPFEEDPIIPMTDQEAIAKGMEMLKKDTGVVAWVINKFWFPLPSGNAVKYEVIAQSDSKSSRLELDYRPWSKID